MSSRMFCTFELGTLKKCVIDSFRYGMNKRASPKVRVFWVWMEFSFSYETPESSQLVFIRDEKQLLGIFTHGLG